MTHPTQEHLPGLRMALAVLKRRQGQYGDAYRLMELLIEQVEVAPGQRIEAEFDDCPASPTGKHSESWYCNDDCDYCKTGVQDAPLYYAAPPEQQTKWSCEALKALVPFAELAELFDDGKRASNMPRDGVIYSWPRLDKEYELTIEHLRAARAALSNAQVADCRSVSVDLIRESVRGGLKEPFCSHCGRSREAMEKLSTLLDGGEA